jgi:hypothetical protein
MKAKAICAQGELGSPPMPLKGLNVYVVEKREDGLK